MTQYISHFKRKIIPHGNSWEAAELPSFCAITAGQDFEWIYSIYKPLDSARGRIAYKGDGLSVSISGGHKFFIRKLRVMPVKLEQAPICALNCRIAGNGETL